MRLTVGPLPSAVYWRRRAIVLGVVVILAFLIVQSCSGGEGKTNGGGVPTSATQGPETTPTAVIKRPQTGAPPAPTKAAVPVMPTSAPAASVIPSVRPPANGSCTDAEVSVLPVPASVRAPRGQTIVIKLRIKNISTRACSRDVGADLQELYIKRGAEKVWSSDTCARAKGTDVQQLLPNIEREYQVAWNGRDVTRCANNVANGPVPAAGDYQVFARLGTKISAPVKLTLT